MGFISKVELKKQLQAMGVRVEGNYVKRSDINKVLSDSGKYFQQSFSTRPTSPQVKKIIKQAIKDGAEEIYLQAGDYHIKLEKRSQWFGYEGGPWKGEGAIGNAYGDKLAKELNDEIKKIEGDDY